MEELLLDLNNRLAAAEADTDTLRGNLTAAEQALEANQALVAELKAAIKVLEGGV